MQNSRTAFLILTLALAGMLALCAGKMLIPMRKGWHLLEVSHPEKPQNGGNDWIRWEDRKGGVFAAGIHPLGMKIKSESGEYVQPGDRLLKLDYVPVSAAAQVEQIVRVAPPGKVFLYQVERKKAGEAGREVLNLFLRNSHYPSWLPARDPLPWSFAYWIEAIAGFASLLGLLIVFPLLRSRWRIHFFKLLAILLSSLVFSLLLTRQVTLSASASLSDASGETLFFSLFGVLVLAMGTAYLCSLAEGRLRLLSLLTGGLAISMVAGTLVRMKAGQFWIYAGFENAFYAAAALLLIWTTLWVSVTVKWKERSFADKAFTSGSLALVGFQLGAVLRFMLMGKAGAHLGDWQLLLLCFSFLIAPVSLTAGELKFGKVNVVLTQSLQYLALGFFSVLMFAGIHELFGWLGLNFRFQAIAELSTLILMLILMRTVYSVFEDRIRKFFTLSQQKRLEELNRFIASIPRFTSSDKLIEELQKKISAFFMVQQVDLERPGGESKIGAANFAELEKSLSGHEDFWSRNKQLSPLQLKPDAESALLKSGYTLVFPIRPKDAEFFLMIGRKNRGVFNLSDIEILGRLLQQTQLSLDVLSLVEREKLLIEKNYEANLTALRSQINPHFLFNTLNTISSLIHDAPDDAETATEKLAYIFRYTLRTSGAKFVSLRDELSLVRTYLEIEKFRFGDRLNVTFDLDENLLDIPIPALVVQTVVENCTKHGIAKIIGKGQIAIGLRKREGFAECEVYDNGPGIDVSRIRSSTGLNNVLTRMKEIYKTENLLYFENTGNGTRVTIRIPIQHEQTESPDRG